MSENKEQTKDAATARLRYVRVSPQKARLVVDQIRGKKIDEALNVLRHSTKAVSRDLEKLLLSAVANAQASGGVDNIDDLYVSRIHVDPGPTMKRIRPRAMGRAFRIIKRMSHVSVGLQEKGKQ